VKQFKKMFSHPSVFDVAVLGSLRGVLVNRGVFDSEEWSFRDLSLVTDMVSETGQVLGHTRQLVARLACVIRTLHAI